MGRVTLDEAATLLLRGEVVGIPTETVYGLAADATQPLAVRRIFGLKGRPIDHPLIVHTATATEARLWSAAWPTVAERLANAFWPGPLTLVVARGPSVPHEVTGGLETVALRVPAHPTTQALLQRLARPLAAPSANRFGRVSPTTADHVLADFGEDLPCVDGGPCAVGVESTIVDCTVSPPAILRPGGISRSAIEAVVGPLGESKTRAPGTLEAHYAPRAALVIHADVDREAERQRASGLRVATLKALPAVDYARVLYAELRRLDQEGVDVVVAGPATGDGLAEAVNDRLRRASSGIDRPR